MAKQKKPLLPIEERRYRLSSGADTYVSHGKSFSQFYNAITNTDLGINRKSAKEIWLDSVNRFSFQEKFSRIKTDKIDYSSLPDSKTNTIREFSFRVQTGWLVDDDGKYITERVYDDKTKKYKRQRIAQYVTVVTDRELTRKQIKDRAVRATKGKEGSGSKWKGIVKIVWGVRRKRI